MSADLREERLAVRELLLPEPGIEPIEQSASSGRGVSGYFRRRRVRARPGSECRRSVPARIPTKLRSRTSYPFDSIAIAPSPLVEADSSQRTVCALHNSSMGPGTRRIQIAISDRRDRRQAIDLTR